MTSRSRWLGIIALILIPASASSLGLGDITLNSYLNERLDAEISISVSDPEEIQSLKVAVASRDVFERFGIDRADMLDDLRFTVEPRSGSQAVVRITSTEPVVEPFLTFLIEAQSSGGRLLREYTVLLDPPLFVPEPETAEPAPAAPIQPAPSAGAISRPRAEPAPAQARPAPVAAATTYGPVRRNETLWGIAEQVRPDPGLTMNQVMLSLFEANPEAFDGNINRLRAGATLRVPDFSGMSRLTRGAAAAEVRRQNSEWRHAAETTSVAAAPVQSAPTPMQEEPEQRLKLVPPEPEKPASVGAGTAGAAGPAEATDEFRTEQEALNEELLAAVTAMREELKDTQEQIAVRDAEIAELQAQLEEMRAGGGEAVEPAAEEPAPRPAPTSAAPPEKPEPAPTPPPAQLAEEEGGIFSSVWTWLLIIVVVLAGGAVAWRRRQESEFDEGYESWASTDRSEAAPAAVAAGAAGGAAAVAATEDDFSAEPAEVGALEEEMPAPEPPVTPEPPPPPKPEPKPAPAAKEDTPDTTGEYAYPFEDTIAGATGINLEQSDPLAEADFHMAYGLYDQAADLIRKAIEREPDRTDLRMKLLDILFVWGKQDEFLEEATALKGQIGDTSSGDWDRVSIMGRQICPDADLFEGEPAGTEPAAATEEGSELDLDLGSETARQGEPESIDFDIGATGELPAIKQEDAPAPDQTAELEIEDLGLDLDLPVEEADRDTVKAPVSGEEAGETGPTEVLERDEGGAEPEETGLTEVFERGAGEPEEETGVTEVMETGADESREETGLTEVLDRVEETADDQTAVVRAQDLDVADMEAEEGTRELPALKADAPPSDEDTAEVEALGEEDLELDDLTASFDEDLDKTAEIPIAGQGPDSDTLIDEIFGDDEETKIAPMPGVGGDGDAEATREMQEVKPSDVTLSEVGTKLDLARAYLDMGDPDGARSILEEVVEEGDDAQKDEARQLLDGLS